MSDINAMVLEAVGPFGLAASAGAGLGGAKLHALLTGAAAAAALPFGIDPVTASSVVGGLLSGGANLAKNFMDPQTQHDYAGNGLRAAGAALTGAIPGLGGLLSTAYNSGGLAYHTFNKSDEYNRQRQLQNWANQTNMIQQARAGNYNPVQ